MNSAINSHCSVNTQRKHCQCYINFQKYLIIQQVLLFSYFYAFRYSKENNFHICISVFTSLHLYIGFDVWQEWSGPAIWIKRLANNLKALCHRGIGSAGFIISVCFPVAMVNVQIVHKADYSRECASNKVYLMHGIKPLRQHGCWALIPLNRKCIPASRQ